MTADRDPRPTVDFGFERVAPEEKTERVRQVFESVATKYDLMNDLMSFGVHRLWKRFALSQTGLKPGMHALDLGGGTGDLALALTEQVGERGRVVLSDINAAMLEVGRGRLIDAGVAGNVEFVQADAEALPFADRSFDCVTIAFALRNVTDKDAALREMRRVLRPGGRALVLEFSAPDAALKPAYDLYSFKVLPTLGKVVADDADSYRYLAESIRMHPDQETLKAMMARAGFDKVEYHNLSGGIVALHKGFAF
jgi:demethylmenaquinone methyltransferase/2-methoxy-6-polyprenyl-1,4-benzoquinol methylase